MSAETALVARLREDATVAGLVGERIYPHVAPTGTDWPLVIYQDLTGRYPAANDGPGGLRFVTIQVTAWAHGTGRYADARELADAIRASLHGVTDEGDLQAVVHQSEIDLDDPETGAAGVAADYLVCTD